MSGSVRASFLAVLGTGLGMMQGGVARAAEPSSFEEVARKAAEAPALDAVVAPYLDDCTKARREIDRARCRGMQAFVQEKLPERTYTTVVDSPNVVSVSTYDAAIKGFRVRLVGCLTCEKPLVGPGGVKRFVTLKVPDRSAASFGSASTLADSTVSFDSVPEARAWEAKVKPHLRAEFVFRPADRPWSYKQHKGVAFAPVASRIFNRCTGEVIFSSPRSMDKVAVDEEVEGCQAGAPVAASGRDKEGGAQTAGAPADQAADAEGRNPEGRNKEGLDGRPEKLGATEISQALRPANSELRACDARFRTRGSVELQFDVPGQGGPAQSVRASGQLGGTEVAQCLLNAVRKVKFPQFQRANQTFSFSVRLQGE
jgi:hypothetical protein